MIDDTARIDAVHPDGPVRLDPARLGDPVRIDRRSVRPPQNAPVFVDTSGRRQRRVRRIGWLLAVPAAGYLALLVSSVLGGPSINAPFLPQQTADRPRVTPTVLQTADPQASKPVTPPAARPAGTARRTPGAAATQAAPTTLAPSTTPSATTAGPGHGRPSAAPDHKPTKSP
ncbi:hypothetical protein GCM10010193_31430 [Kitasatospora atroaurantiaca]|uniref:Uncharacterized protein n=1 Tax=Kitasatospora atroaurantiaca TaxID=285545 RepID=A0A561ERB1_9ACTN|nr:hypothetical protein [Kitasatospora atroaurantiaca]TWE18129.1 hypothetical protein FB465_3178 [Kitasatospora atroaurantiaca]